MDGMMIPFIMLLIITIALLLERKYHEDKIVKIYEEKYKQWQKHSGNTKSEPTKCKELVGLVFQEDTNIVIETFHQQNADKLKRGKYSIITKDTSCES